MDQLTILRYIIGECTPEERERVLEWSLTTPEREHVLRQLQDIWDAGSVSEGEMQYHVDEDWHRLQQRIELAELTRPVRPVKRLKKYKRGGAGHAAAIWMKVAALLLVSLIGGLAFWMLVPVEDLEEAPLVMREVVMERGQLSNMLLSDGSHITINAESRVRLPERFESDRRDLYLDSGEIFVDIESDPDRPFYIHAEGSVIRVLGTAFSVRSYPEVREVRVVVKEGVVSLASSLNDERHITLTENQVGRFHIDDNQLSSDMVNDLDLFLGWIDGYFKFEQTSLRQVARELERRYNVTIRFEDDALAEKRLTAELRGRSIQNVLTVISAALDLRIRQLDEEVILFSRESALSLSMSGESVQSPRG